MPVIVVGSANQVKVNAVRELLGDYPFLAGASVRGLEVPSEVSAQPMSLEETVRGAMNRARNAFADCDLSIGIESGLMPVPYSKTGHMAVCAGVVHDGREYHLGISSLFECPKDVTDMITAGVPMAEAFHRCGYTTNPKLAASEGVIGVLTKGRIDRKQYTMQALRMAFIHLERQVHAVG